ncbi:MAG: D-alanyl-D-alanine carboxypeptidase/D-alanyl-D-alanine-endopeptidase [Flavobacteriaceae bacterium]|jgi:D-alanyl-D-alanine carboxypeptidase/D-alanyl-D-alanine-endopeptidase (penicillin-binding protein 4)|nr:D-alanyl-D-alanine carboxypeptidase/D-alanyl-D-alanine-endopeptidase [Flavobacteriaceae bacterium]
MNNLKKTILITSIFRIFLLWGQGNIPQKLESAVKNLMNSQAAYSANLSFYVSDETGKFIYEFNGNKGLSSASTQKIFTAACALETLGKNYRYSTSVSFSGNLNGGKLDGNLYIFSNGDPTLGSWRYENFKPENFKQKFLEALQKKGISEISGDLILDDSYFDFQTTPGGWPWNDMGNYYGAGVWGINWRENQFDLNVNGSKIQNSNIELPNVKWVSELSAGGNSDQSLIFTAPFSNVAFINGMLPAGKTTTVSGATPNPPLAFGYEIKNWLKENNIQFSGKIVSVSEQKINGEKISVFPKENVFLEYQSPTLDKIIYWFMRKSVNFYGETLIKTIGKEKKKTGSFDAGVSYLKEFWKSKGIQSAMINFADGSGLSPQNYVSARAEVQALIYAKKQTWFAEFYEGFPTHENGMKMKSGTMKNTKSFAGYYKGFAFSIIINNYQGNDISDALFKVLNVLK